MKPEMYDRYAWVPVLNWEIQQADARENANGIPDHQSTGKVLQFTLAPRDGRAN